jgi:2-isopropylmalate synthase
MASRIYIFDTTLRDGEQSPGASLNAKEKVEIARQLSCLGVDIIEAGFPVASPGDFASVKMVAHNIKRPIICGLARAIPKDIDIAARALESAKRKRLHVFLATSPIHRKFKLRKAKEEILRLAKASIKRARNLVEEVEFSPEDAARTEIDFLCQVVEEAIRAGARIVNIPDTVGYAVPDEFGDIIKNLYNRVPNIARAVISVHCHNDLGLATANSIAGIMNGARQVECTINGLGERAGNASLEEIVMAIRTRSIFDFTTGINTKELYRTSHLVSALTGIPVQPNKAIVGRNAFRHEAGIHQDGILKKRTTYEIMRPEDVGMPATSLVMGKHSGRHAFSNRLMQLGYSLKKEELEAAYQGFIKLADRKKEIFDADIVALVEEEVITIPQIYQLDYIHTISGNRTIPTATIRLKKEGKILEGACSGDGPVDAACKAIDKLVGIKTQLVDYSLRAVTKGKDALGEVMVKVKSADRVVLGRGISTDIIEASAKAYLNAINKLVAAR